VAVHDFVYRALTLFRRPSQTVRLSRSDPLMGSYNPGATWTPVWASPGSLATTTGISFDFFSSGY
jgi:hypothetical protein